jgi:hypothetical protein
MAEASRVRVWPRINYHLCDRPKEGCPLAKILLNKSLEHNFLLECSRMKFRNTRSVDVAVACSADVG